MSSLTNLNAIRRLVQLSADACKDSRSRCHGQLAYLYNQRQALVAQRQKRAERRKVEIAELSALCESMALKSVPAL